MGTSTLGTRRADRLSRRTTTSGRRYLSGVQGLRTVAALLVATYHIWFSRVSGGVDVFFVVAGFFATLSLLKLDKVDGIRGRIQFVGQYLLRTARRVVPSASIVVAATAVAAVAWMPTSLWSANFSHGVASIAFAENWQLIRTETDYLQQGFSASPFQQFWALAIQVQFYVLFPVIMFAAIVLATMLGASGKRAVFVTALVVFLGSFAYSVYLTALDQPVAYFNTFTRLWEFMAGALLAVLLVREIRSKVLASVLGWVGLLVLIFFGAALDLSAFLPGAVSLIPVTSAILIILSSYSSSEPAILRSRPVLWFADASFAFYLWHWPLLIVYRLRIDEDVNLLGGVAILLLSALLAVATTRFVEAPIRNSAPLQRSLVATLVAGSLTLIPAAAGLGYWKLTNDHAYAAAAADVEALTSGAPSTGALVPAPIYARDDIVDSYTNGCHQTITDPEVIPCVSGEEGAAARVALVGGSHSLQWLNVVREVAANHDAEVVSMTKSACVFGDVAALNSDEYHPSCKEWSSNVLAELLGNPPDAVITIATRQIDGREEIPDGYRVYFDALSSAGIPVVGIRDNPWFDDDIPPCIELRGAAECGIDRTSFYREITALDVPELDQFTFVDTADDYCTATECGVIDGAVLMYRDRHHLTGTWTLQHGQRVAGALREVID